MRWDQEPAQARLKQQDKTLRAYLVHELYPFSAFYRARFDQAGVEPRSLKSLTDLATFPLTQWDDVAASPFDMVLRPDEESIAHYGNRRLVLAVTRAKLRGGSGEVNRDVIDRAFKPIHWHLDEGAVPVGSSYEDVERLAEAGHRVLAVAGMTRYDVLVTVSAPVPSLAYWQLVLGARAAGVSALHLGHEIDPDLVVAAAPTVLAGSSGELLAVLTELEDRGRSLPDLNLLLVAGEVPDETTRDLLRASGKAVGRRDLDVVAAYAPPGVRALWAHCRGGDGFHTYPDLEWLETVDPAGQPVTGTGELVWTSVGWRGTALFRLRTGITATLRDEPCPTCQRVGVRLFTTAAAAPGPVAAPQDAVAWLQQSDEPEAPAPRRRLTPLRAVRQPAGADDDTNGEAATAASATSPARIDAGRDEQPDAAGDVEDDELAAFEEEDEEGAAEPEELEDEELDEDVPGEDEPGEDELDEDGEPAAPVPALETVRAATADTVLPEELEVLRDHAGIAAWQAEYRWVGDDEELLVFLAPAQSGHPGPLCREIDRTLQATQYVVLPAAAVADRVARAGLVVDLRD